MKIVLGITGGIAAYKAPQLVRDLQRAGHEVAAVVTPSATEFVSPMVLKTLCDGEVLTNIFEAEKHGVGHINLADWADLMVVAPATAQSIARFAQGMADDPVSLILLAATCPKLVFPAMNTNMWMAAATRRNIDILRQDGLIVVDPDSGDLACGWQGAGRLPDPERIISEIARFDLPNRPTAWQDKSVLITAGPTREFIDPVRYLSNPSSGKMGYALAAAAAKAGAVVTLISGPTTLPAPENVNCLQVVSAQEMYEAVHAEIERKKPDVFIGAAAVADYTPANVAEKKHKKDNPMDQINLVPTKDILASVAARKVAGLVIGFAAETDDVIAHARAKQQKKDLDLIVANDVSEPDAGFSGDNNHVWLIDRQNVIELASAGKPEIAGKIISHIAGLL